jgi:AhpD family alkylhydroperoxidase
MDSKIKELIAVGASVTANCIPCFKFHYKKAREAGAADEDIKKAVNVGRMVRKGAAAKWDEEINSLLSIKEISSTGDSDKSCGS